MRSNEIELVTFVEESKGGSSIEIALIIEKAR